MRQPLVAGNWKMNGTRASAAELVGGLKAGLASGVNAEVLVCPPAILIGDVAGYLEGSVVRLGAQDVSEHGPGAYTGDIAAEMLRDYGCGYVIVGHSERRAYHHETDELVARKCLAAHNAGVRPILCVGETLAEREQGETEAVVARQLDALLNESKGLEVLAEAVVAYEPVWAIGTGKTATPDQAQAVHQFIRGRVAGRSGSIAQSLRILYGGSVKAGNAAELFEQPDIDGGLIGGASLKAEEFLAICRAC